MLKKYRFGFYIIGIGHQNFIEEILSTGTIVFVVVILHNLRGTTFPEPFLQVYIREEIK